MKGPFESGVSTPPLFQIFTAVVVWLLAGDYSALINFKLCSTWLP